MVEMKAPEMLEKIYDRILLVISLIVVSPLILLAVLVVAIGYPLHLVKERIVK